MLSVNFNSFLFASVAIFLSVNSILCWGFTVSELDVDNSGENFSESYKHSGFPGSPDSKESGCNVSSVKLSSLSSINSTSHDKIHPEVNKVNKHSDNMEVGGNSSSSSSFFFFFFKVMEKSENGKKTFFF